MLPISAKDVIRFTPRVELLAWLQARLDEATDVEQHEALERQIGKVQDEIDAAPQPVYLLAVASHLQRAAFRRDLLATGATYAGDAALYAALREDLEAVAPVNLPELLGIVDEVEAAGKPADAAPEVRDRWPGITRVARALGGRFAALEGDQEFYLSVAPIVACRHFLLGWENVGAPFTRRGNLTTDETLAALEEGEMQAIGFKAMNLMRPTKALEKKLRIAVAVSLQPEAFPDGAEAPDGSAWLLYGERFERNPRLGLTDGDLEMVRYWRAYRPHPGRIGGMAAGIIPAAGHLPEAGGYGDQAAIMLDAFEIMSAAEAELLQQER